MEGLRSYQSYANIGHETSFDVAQRQIHPSLNGEGQKRKFDASQTHHTAATSLSLLQSHHASSQRWRVPQNVWSASKVIDISPYHQSEEVSRVNEGHLPDPQRQVVSEGIADDPFLSLGHPKFDLPARLVSNFASLGVKSMYEWQRNCLVRPGLLNGSDNLVYTAPTGGGKSLVADVLLLKRIIENPTKKAIVVLPFVALVQEKLRWYRNLVQDVNKIQGDVGGTPVPTWKQPHVSSIRVAGFFGGSRAMVGLADIDIAICTIEKANSLVNSAFEDGSIEHLGAVVVDEFHMIDDEDRGYLIELMLTKLLCLNRAVGKMQIIGMSATLSNIETIAAWLGAKYYVAKHRPVDIQEFLVYDSEVYPTADSKAFLRTASQLSSPSKTQKPPAPSRTIQHSHHKELENPIVNAVVALAVETANAGYGALIFCSSRQGTQTMAQLISKTVPSIHIGQNKLDERLELIATLQALPGGHDPTLSETIVKGVAFHHAGLTSEERDSVAEAYDKGILKILVATCSLAAGCNLPARRVILNGARMGRDLVGPSMFRQMRGRAGRKGKDDIGEVYVCCQKADLEAVAELLEAEIPAITSCLTPEKRGITRALLEVVVTRLATTHSSLQDYMRQSLLRQITEESLLVSMVNTAMEGLATQGLVSLTEGVSFEATRLGQAIVASSLSPSDGIFVHEELQRALRSLVMDGELHIFYLFTPVRTNGLCAVSWKIFCDQMEALDESGMRTIMCIGVSPALVHRLALGGVMREDTVEEVNRARIYRRVYSAFQLRDMCNEVPIHEVSLRYKVPRGQVQSLAQHCHGWAAGQIKFCERMGWGMLAAVLEHMVDRLRAGARADLLEMSQIPFVKSRMARILWENGLKSVRALSEADAKDLLPIMMQAQGRRLRLNGEAAEKLKEKLLLKAQIIVTNASRLWEHQQLIEFDE